MLAQRARMGAAGGGGSGQYAIETVSYGANVGSDPSIDDLPSGSFSLDFWLNYPTQEGWFSEYILSQVVAGKGYSVRLGSNNGLSCLIDYSITDASVYVSRAAYGDDGVWHHYVIYHDASEKKLYMAQDGVWAASYGSQVAGEGDYNSAADFNISLHNGNEDLMQIAWLRISNGNRFTPGNNFTPNDKTDPPTIDANTIEQWNFNDGSGTTYKAEINSANDATVTAINWVAL